MAMLGRDGGGQAMGVCMEGEWALVTCWPLQVAAEYFKNTTLLLVGVICVAAAVEKWNLHKRIALRMVMMAGAKPGM